MVPGSGRQAATAAIPARLQGTAQPTPRTAPFRASNPPGSSLTKAPRYAHTNHQAENMPTNRPFLSNFLAAFRAHSVISQASAANPSTTSQTSSQQPSHHTATAATTATTHPSTNPRTIASKSLAAGPTTTAVQTLQSTRTTQQAPTSPISRSPGTPAASHMGGSSGRRRRSSSSSTEGFRDALGGEKWWIGGRSAGGEERFYRLGTVRRHRSIDRLSLDELSL